MLLNCPHDVSIIVANSVKASIVFFEFIGALYIVCKVTKNYSFGKLAKLKVNVASLLRASFCYMRCSKNDIRHYLNNVRHCLNNIRHRKTHVRHRKIRGLTAFLRDASEFKLDASEFKFGGPEFFQDAV